MINIAQESLDFRCEDFSSSSKWFTDLKHAGEIEYSKDGLSMTLAKRYDNPSLKSNFYLMYGMGKQFP